MFDDIRPYYDAEIPAAMHRIAAHPSFPVLASFVFPDREVEEVRQQVASITNIKDFQHQIMYAANRQIIERSTSGFTFGGIENIDPAKPYLYISNHRDIMLDASLLQNVLIERQIGTSEITFGENLMRGELVIDIGKSNKMFKVERPGGSIMEFYKSSMHLSDYIRNTILEKKQSVWIAQRNGRTKDGIDRTDQGIIKMFAMSRNDDHVKSLAELNILPVSVSYEWESCDILKTLELYARRQGPYKKAPGEDLNSILTGILQPKGHVHFEICRPLEEAELRSLSHLSPSEYHRQVAHLIDQRICSSYHLMPTNYIAHDLKSGTSTYAAHYTTQEKESFLKRMTQLDAYADKCDVGTLRQIFLGIYASSVDSKIQFTVQ